MSTTITTGVCPVGFLFGSRRNPKQTIFREECLKLLAPFKPHMFIFFCVYGLLLGSYPKGDFYTSNYLNLFRPFLRHSNIRFYLILSI